MSVVCDFEGKSVKCGVFGYCLRIMCRVAFDNDLNGKRLLVNTTADQFSGLQCVVYVFDESSIGALE